MLDWYKKSAFNQLHQLIVLVALAGCHLKKETALEKEQDGMEQAMKQEIMMTKDPALNTVPIERLLTAKQYAASFTNSFAARVNDINWQERGPNNIGGRTRALVIDARDASGNTVFAASVSGGIWKTTNFKSTPNWTPVAEQMANLAVCALAQDPVNQNVLYAGTGEGWFNVDAIRGVGIFKSTDGGSTWTLLSATANNANFDYVEDIVVTPAGIVFASTRSGRFCNNGGVYRSADAGSTWTRVIGSLNGSVCDSAYNFRGADLEVASNGDVYATTGFQGNTINLRGRIFRAAASGSSTGNTWQDITPPGAWRRIEVGCAPNNPAVVYALLQGTGEGIGGIRRTANSGATWDSLALPPWCNRGVTQNDFTNGQAWYNLIVSVDPTNSSTVIMGGIDLFKSTNGGDTWTQITQWASGCFSLPNIHADQHNIIFYPGSSSEFIAVNDGGVYYTGNGGTSWANKNGGYNVTQLYGVDFHPTATNYFLVGAQDNNSLKLTSAGIGSATAVSGGDGGFPHIDQTNGLIQVTAYVYNNYFYSRNGGASFSDVPAGNNEGMFINPTDYDDANDVLYTGNTAGSMGVVTGFNGAGNPSFNTVQLSSLGGREISAVRIDPTVTNGTVWMAGYSGNNAPVLLKLVNAHTLTPQVSTATLPASLTAGYYISCIDIDPFNANHLLITLSNYGVPSVWESIDGGFSFNNIEGNLPDMPVRWGLIVPPSAAVPGNAAGGILLATEVGVWYSAQSSSGAWIPQTSGLPNVRTDMLKLRPADNLLAAATHGRGLFTSTLTSVPTGLPTVNNTRDFIKYVAETGGQLIIKTGNLNTTKMKIALYDVNGRLIRMTDAKYEDQALPVSLLPGGSYVLKIYGDKKEQYTKQFVK
jgi:hypothetical protein